MATLYINQAVEVRLRNNLHEMLARTGDAYEFAPEAEKAAYND